MKQLLYLMLIFPIISFAQGREISGKIFDEYSAPLPGASITVTGINLGTTSDFDGVFKLKVPENAKTVSISYLGYKDKLVEINSSNNYLVQLEVDTNNLDEVVIVGYGTQKRSDITGSVVSVKVSDAVSQQSQTVDQLLRGRAAGVQMVGNDATPNAGVSIRIRGATSLRGNQEPLYVVDGVIISTANQDAVSAGAVNGDVQEAQNGLNGINPRDIESMEILKDASATAIYGSRGANGVVLITTKKGVRGNDKVNAYVTSTYTQLDNQIDVLRGVEYARYRNESLLLLGADPAYSVVGNNVFPLRNIDGGLVADTEPSPLNYYQDDLYSMGKSTTAGVSISGGTKSGSHYVSLGYNSLGGITDNSQLENANLRLNITRKLSENLKFNTRVSAYYGEGSMFQSPNRFGGNSSIVNSALLRNPISNSAEDNDNQQIDPILAQTDFDDISEELRIIGSVSMEYQFPGFKGLKYTLRAAGNIRKKERLRWFGINTFRGQFNNGSYSESKLSSSSVNIDNLLNYNRTFNKIHRINALLGVSYDQVNSENSIYGVQDFVTYTFRTQQPAYGQTINVPLQVFPSKTQLLSYMSRLNYSFRNRYVLTATFRADGSSKFSEENKYSYFPSLAFAWRASQEPFIKNLSFINNLKLRLGWGTTGNQAINAYQTISTYGSGLYSTPANSTVVTFSQQNIANPNLKWETTIQTNIGLDFGLFNGRLSGSVDAYMNKTKDLLQNADLPGSTGFNNMFVNRGSLSSKGIEAALSAVLADTKDFTLDIGGNIAFNRTIIDDLDRPSVPVFIDGVEEQRSNYLGNNVSNNPYNIFIEGEEIGLFYGYKTNGIYQSDDTELIGSAQPGDIKFVDVNGDGTIDLNDRTTIGNPNPEFIYGLSLNLKYKKWTMNAQFDGVYGNEIAIGNFTTLDMPEGNQNNITTEAYRQAWRANAPSNTYPRIGSTVWGLGAITDRVISDGSYFRLNNLTVGYEIPAENLFDSCQLYVAANNLLTITNYRGYTPLITSYLNNSGIKGVDWNNPPNSQSITLGLTVNF